MGQALPCLGFSRMCCNLVMHSRFFLGPGTKQLWEEEDGGKWYRALVETSQKGGRRDDTRL